MSSLRRLLLTLALIAGPTGVALAYVGIVPLSTFTVVTGSTPVTALPAGGANSGGMIITANAAGICVNQQGAAGTATSNGTICVAANTPFYLIPNGNAVSVNSTASGVVFAGWGLN